MPYPAISVVIPVKNEALKIRACLDGILSQTVPVKEIIVIDSGSVDGTQDIVRSYNETVLVEIPSSAFNHGTTRNLGVSKATGEFVLMTVGDARALNKTWIEELLKGFTDDTVAGVCGQQVVPHEKDKNPVEWFRPVSQPELKRYQFSTANEFEQLSAAEKTAACGWDDVTALYRKSVLQQIPFQQITYGEDPLWAKDALMNGYALVYNYKAKVYHYHLENEEFTFKRAFTTTYFRYKQFGFLYEEPVLPLRSKLSILKTLAAATNFNPVSILKWYRYNTANFKAGLKAYRLFMKHLQQGDDSLDAAHEQYCGKPPVPQKAM